MRKIAIAAGVAALLCVGSVAMAEPAQVDYESMTLEEVKALADEANAYYKDQTTTGSEKAKEARELLNGALEEMYPGQTISGPLFGFDVKRERTVYTIDGSFTAKLEKQKTTHTVHAVFEDAEGLSFTELVVDGNAADAPERAEVEPTQMPEATAEPTAEPENKKGFNDYGELLDLTETDGICVLKYKITSSATKKMTVNQNYYTVVNFIKDGGGDQYDEIQYWAVADMQDGSESKVISFTVSKDLIEKIKAGTFCFLDHPDQCATLYLVRFPHVRGVWRIQQMGEHLGE